MIRLMRGGAQFLQILYMPTSTETKFELVFKEGKKGMELQQQQQLKPQPVQIHPNHIFFLHHRMHGMECKELYNVGKERSV